MSVHELWTEVASFGESAGSPVHEWRPCDRTPHEFFDGPFSPEHVEPAAVIRPKRFLLAARVTRCAYGVRVRTQQLGAAKRGVDALPGKGIEEIRGVANECSTGGPRAARLPRERTNRLHR